MTHSSNKNNKPETRKLWVLSTAHLKKETAQAHNQYDEASALWPLPYGYITWAWDTEDQSTKSCIPEDLLEVLRFLKTHHNASEGDYFRFDCDGPTVPGLKTYTW